MSFLLLLLINGISSLFYPVYSGLTFKGLTIPKTAPETEMTSSKPEKSEFEQHARSSVSPDSKMKNLSPEPGLRQET